MLPLLLDMLYAVKKKSGNKGITGQRELCSRQVLYMILVKLDKMLSLEYVLFRQGQGSAREQITVGEGSQKLKH